MSSDISLTLLTALTQPAIEPYYAVELLFDDSDGTRWDQAGYLGNRANRLWTGNGSRTIEGNSYLGSGDLLSIGGLEQTSDLSAKGATVTLSGIPDTLIALALTEPYQGRKARVLFGERSVSDVMCVFAGLIDTMPIKHGPESITISGGIESKLVTLQRANIRRYTPESHKLRHPSDTFFDWVAGLQDKEILWGRTTAD